MNSTPCYMEKHRRNRYAHWLYIYAGLFLAFAVANILERSTLPAGVQLALVLGTIWGTPFLIKRLFNFASTNMKHILSVCLVLAFASCHNDYEPLLWQELQGKWTRTDNQNRHYIFAQDYATEWDYNFSTNIAPKWYSMEQTGYRTLTLVNINTGDTSHWIVGQVLGDTAVSINDVTHPDWKEFYLKRN